MKKILMIDYSIFYSSALDLVKYPKEYDYSLKNSDLLDTHFDFELYATIQRFINTTTANINYLIRSKDIVDFISDKSEIVLFSHNPCNDDFNMVITRDNWADYLSNKGLISNVTWLYSGYKDYNDINFCKEYFRLGGSIQETNLAVFEEFDEVFLVLSPEVVPARAQELFFKSYYKCDIYESQLNRFTPITCKVGRQFSTLLQSDRGLNNVISLAYNLSKTSSGLLNVYITKGVSSEVKDILTKLGIKFELAQEAASLEDSEYFIENNTIITNTITCKEDLEKNSFKIDKDYLYKMSIEEALNEVNKLIKILVV